MTTLLLKTSLFGDAGQSSHLASELAAARGGRLIVRDLAKDPVPHLSAERFQAFLAEPGTRTPEQELVVDYSDRLIGELKAADIIVIGLPSWAIRSSERNALSKFDGSAESHREQAAALATIAHIGCLNLYAIDGPSDPKFFSRSRHASACHAS